MRRRLRVGILGVMIAAGASLPVGASAAPVYVKPGDTGTVKYPIENSPSSAGTLPMSLLVSAPPSFDLGSVPGVDIPIAQTHIFNLGYTVSSGAQDGPADIVLTPASSLDSALIDPEPSQKSFHAGFPIVEAPFLVGARLRDVWQGEAFGGLKFRRERRAYRQAGRRLGLFSLGRIG